MNCKLNIPFTLLFVYLFSTAAINAQQKVPFVVVNDLQFEPINIREAVDTNSNTIVVFWNVWSHVSAREIENLLDLKEELKTKYNTEIILVNWDIINYRN